jgi:predicted NBD/HSP70 family sugar kinase
MNQKKLNSFDAAIIKDVNEKLVLKLIREHVKISSSELVRITGMRPSTIFNITKKLLSQNLIVFLGKGGSTQKGGKKPYVWSVNKDAAFSIGVNIKVNEMTIVLLNLAGEYVAKKIIPVDIAKTLDEVFSNIVNAVEDVIALSGVDRTKILGLGIGFAGIVDNVKGIVIMSGVFPEMNFHLTEKLKDHFDFPIEIENDANAVAVGSKWMVKVRGKKDYMTALIEMDRAVAGFGIGIVINGELYHGASFCSGELYPHIPQVREILAGMRIRLSEGKVLRDFVEMIDNLNINFLIEAAKQGDEIALLFFSKLGNSIGQIIAPAVALLNPETLVICGNMTELDEILIEPIRSAIEMHVLSIANKALTITATEHGHYAVAMGAASIVLEEYFRVPSI